MKKAVFMGTMAIALLSSRVAVADSPWVNPFLDEVARKGSYKTELVGASLDLLHNFFGTNGALVVQGKVVKNLPKKGCKRVHVTYLMPGVTMPTGRGDMTVTNLVDHCPGGVKGVVSQGAKTRQPSQNDTAVLVNSKSFDVTSGVSKAYTFSYSRDVLRDPKITHAAERHFGLRHGSLSMPNRYSSAERAAITMQYLEETGQLDVFRRMS